MIIRIVKLTFQEDKLEDFQNIWKESKSKIINMNGCHFVEMMQSKSPSNVCFTYSIWDDEDRLNEYRHSEVFKATWAKTKVLFADKPQAWTTESKGFEGSLIVGLDE